MRALFLLVCFVVFCAVASADKPGTDNGKVLVRSGTYNSVAITTATSMYVTDAAKYSDLFYVGQTQVQSVMWTIEATAAMSAVVEVQGSLDGTNFYSFSTAEEFTVTNDESKVYALSIPAVPYIRFEFNVDTVAARGYEVRALKVSAW